MEPASAASCSPSAPSPASTQVCPPLRHVATVRPFMSNSRTDVPAASTSTPRRRDVERLAADDRVGDLAAVLDVVDGRGGAASDLAAVAAGGAPALRRPVRERDPVLLDPEVVARRRGRGGRGRAGGERGRVLDGRAAGRDEHGREHGDRRAGDREREPAAAAPVQAARVALPLALQRLAQAERRADLVGGAVDQRAGAALAVQRVGDRRVVRRERLELAHARGLQRAVGGSRDLRHQAVVEGFRRRHRGRSVSRVTRGRAHLFLTPSIGSAP